MAEAGVDHLEMSPTVQLGLLTALRSVLATLTLAWSVLVTQFIASVQTASQAATSLLIPIAKLGGTTASAHTPMVLT